MAKDATTIYIDDSAIWVLTTKGRHAQKWVNMPLEPGLVKDGVILEEDAVANKVGELWRTQKIGTGRVIAGISGINCLYRLLTLPELPRDLLPEAVMREAGRLLGIPLEQLYLSWQTLPSLRGEILVYLVASPKNSVDALISTLRKAGLNPYLMDLKPLALARTITEPRAIIIDLQPANFDIVVVADGIPQVARSLPLTQQVPLEEKASVIKKELDRAITFYNSGHVDNPIEVSVPLLVSGELTEQQHAWKALIGKQERPVQALSLPMQTPENFPPGQYVTNIGLALKEVLASEKGAIAYSLVNFNALPEVYIPKARPLSEVLFIPTIVAGIILVAFAGFFNITASAYTAALRNELASINQRILSQQVRAQDIIGLSQGVSSLEETADVFTNMLHGLTTGREEVNGDLAKINESLKIGGINLESVNHDTRNITIEGLADREDAIFTYAKDLRASGRFVQVVITRMEETQEGERLSFTLTLVK
jgi:type IV pilus assembly protein PilM